MKWLKIFLMIFAVVAGLYEVANNLVFMSLGLALDAPPQSHNRQRFVLRYAQGPGKYDPEVWFSVDRNDNYSPERASVNLIDRATKEETLIYSRSTGEKVPLLADEHNPAITWAGPNQLVIFDTKTPRDKTSFDGVTITYKAPN